MLRRAILGVLAVSPLLAQKPLVVRGGVVNAASFAQAGTPGGAVAPGSIVSIFGTNLAPSAASAQQIPLPQSLAGVSVKIGGMTAPLYYVSPGQINAQVPAGVKPGQPALVEVTTDAGTSDPVTVDIVPESFGLFTIDASGCGRGAVLNVARDGSVSLNSPENSAEPGGIVTVWGTGMTTVSPFPADGTRGPSDPPLASYLQLAAYEYDAAGSVPWAGKAPGLVGVDQFNISLRADKEGCSVPLRVQGVYSNSQPVAVSIRRGAGACVDPPRRVRVYSSGQSR